MPIDPVAAAILGQIDSKLAGVAGVAADLAARTAALQANAAELRAALAGGVIVPPPPPPTTTPITIGTVLTSRPDAASVKVDYVLMGSLERATKLAVSVVPGGWQEYPAPTALTGSFLATVNVKPGAGSLHFHVWDAGGIKGETGAWVIKSNVPYPAAAGVITPPIDPPPPPPPPTTDDRVSFTTDKAGHPIFTLDGKGTVLLGANGSGQHGYWGGGLKAAGKSASWAGWGWNLLRLFEQDPGGGECTFCPDAKNPETTAQVVKEYTDKGIAVMLDYHQGDFGSELTPAHNAAIKTKWQAWAAEYASNPLVLFELYNEPEATFHSYNHGATDWNSAFVMMCQRWLAAFGPAIDAIRATGARNVIVVDDAQAGQGCDDFWQIGPSAGSAIIAVGAQLVARDPLHRVAFTWHPYDAFGWGGAGEQNNQCEPRYTDAQRDARLTDYVRRVYAATGRPLIAGEFGWQNGENALTGSGFHYPYTQCGSRTLRGQQALTRAGRVLSVSATQWIGFQMTLNGNNGFDSANLTACGQDFMGYCQALKGGPVADADMVADHMTSLDAALTFEAAAPSTPLQRPARYSLAEMGLYRPQRAIRDWTVDYI